MSQIKNIEQSYNEVNLLKPTVYVVCRWSGYTNSYVPIKVFDDFFSALTYRLDIGQKFPSSTYHVFTYEQN